MKRKISQKVQAKIIQQLQSGKRPGEIGPRFGLTAKYVGIVALRAGLAQRTGRPRGTTNENHRSTARGEAAGLLVLATTDEISIERLRDGILVSPAQEHDLANILGPATARSIAQFRQQVAAEFDRLARTQLAQIQARADKKRRRIARRRPIIARQQATYQRAWEARRAQERATA